MRSESVRETPDGPPPQSLRISARSKGHEYSGKVFGSFESALDERLLEDHLRRDRRQFTSLPRFHLLFATARNFVARD